MCVRAQLYLTPETPWSPLDSFVREISREEYWSGLLFPTSGGLPNPGTELRSPALAGGFFTTTPPGKPKHLIDVTNQYMRQLNVSNIEQFLCTIFCPKISNPILISVIVHLNEDLNPLLLHTNFV